MKFSDYLELIDFAKVGETLVPIKNHINLINELEQGELISMKIVAPRDIKMHRCYFAMLQFIYAYMPRKFKATIKLEDFYRWLQGFKKDYETIYTYNDGHKLVKYNSISFGRMNEKKFRDYVKMQLPFIYENVIGKYYENQTLSDIIETIEMEFEKYFSKLFAIN